MNNTITPQFNTRMEAFLARISDDRPANIPELPPEELNRFKAFILNKSGFDIIGNTIVKQKPEIDYKNDFFIWAKHNPDKAIIKHCKNFKEVWVGGKCVSIK